MQGIFLSYARGDDEPYTRTVYDRLRAEGYDVWFDREHMPSRALTFLQEIRDAVRSRDRLVVVLGPAAVRSDYVRAEWQAALVDSKVVTPVLRLGDYDLVPAELKNFHCPDVRAGRSSDQAFDELLRVLSDPIPPLGALHGAVPEMPAHFQPRPDDLSALAGTVLYDIEHPAVIAGPLRTTVLHGMGGVGKSVIAAAFARSSSARRVFGDGIIWVPATPTTPALDILRTVMVLTGSPLHAEATLAEAVTALRTWLDTRRCLIVLDNVWHVEQAAPIGAALSTVSRLLLTTRDANLATALGANARPLDVLAPDAALRHLADWVGTTVDDLPGDARAVAKETGYLPLALSLQGALARDGVPWADLLHALRHAELAFAEQHFPDYPYPHVLAALRVSVDMLRAENASAADRFIELAGFVWDDGVPEAAVTRYWAYGAGGIPEHHARRLLVTLERKALIRLDGTAPHRRVRLHDLMVDFVVALGDGVAANQKLVAAYRAACRTDWPDGPNDGYFLEHLLDHLARLPDANAELYRLLRLEDANGHHGWFEAVDAAGRVDRYRQQLQRQLTDAATTEPSAARLALLLGSLTARAANMPTSLLDALVARGVWSPSRALDYARQLPVTGRRGYATDSGLRMRALLAVASHLPESERQGVVDEALAAARDADESTSGLGDLALALAAAGRATDALTVARRASHGDARTAALAAVAKHVVGADREPIITEAVEDCATTGGLFRSAALEPLLPLLDGPRVKSVFITAVEPLESAVPRGWCESTLVGRLAELGLVAEALAMARSIEDATSRADALSNLVARLEGNAKGATIDAVLETLAAIDDDRWRSDIEAAFDDLPSPLAEVVPVIFAEQFWRPPVLRRIAPHLAGVHLATAFQLVRETNDGRALAEGVAAIVPALSDDARTELLEHATRQVREIDSLEVRAAAVAALAPALDAPQRKALITDTLGAVAGTDESIRVKALTSLATVLSPEEVPLVLEQVRHVTDVEARVSLVDALVPVLAPTQLSDARAVIDIVGDGDECLLATAALARHAGSERHRTLLRTAAEYGDYLRARALALLVPHLSDDTLGEATELLTTIMAPESLAEVALPAFARRLAEPRRTELLRLAIETAASITDAEGLAWAFEAFRDLLSPDLLDEALEAFAEAESCFEPEWRAFGRARYLVAALPRLAPPRRDAVFDEIVALVAELPEANIRRDLLSLLATNGDVTRFGDVVELIEAESDPYERGLMAGFVIGKAPGEFRGPLLDAALGEFEAIQATEDESVTERVEAVISRVAAYAEDPRHALGIVSRFQSERWKRPALLEFAHARRPELFDDTLELARGLTDASDRAEVLTALAGAAPNGRRSALLGEALVAVMRDHSDLLHDNVLSELAAALESLPPGDVHTLWHDQRARLGEVARPELLRKLHGLAPAILHADPDVATAAVDAIFDVRRWWP